MKKLSKLILFSIASNLCFAGGPIQTSNIPNTEVVRNGNVSSVPSFIKFKKGYEVEKPKLKTWMAKYFQLNQDYDLILLSTEKDQQGYTHYRYQQLYKNIPVQSSMVIVHCKNDKIESINGDLFNNIKTSIVPVISEKEALAKGLNFVNAEKYKWQSEQEEQHLKQQTKNQKATYYPKAQLVILPQSKNKPDAFALTYKFDVYASKPLKRMDVFVDAASGKVVHHIDKIHYVDVAGTAMTKYSGTQTITVSTSGSVYHLTESGRGNGIETYNLNKGHDYSVATNFVDSDNVWNNYNVNLDEAATDAHWAAEKTYDYYFNVYGRNSIDGNGLTLSNYVHYDTAYFNAFWDGQEMTYGDGDTTNAFKPLTSIDVGGHEITHGLTQYTANLDYTDESAALNESFSDIFGKVVEHYARPANSSWEMGKDIGYIFRSMSNPKNYNQPNTYKGMNWDSLTMEPHQNNGVQNFWFYLLCEGGTGVNDLNHTYTVTAIGMDKAAAITYKTLTMYLVPSSNYLDSRFYSIQAAMDLYGNCSPEVISVTNAWYAVGIGEVYSNNATSDFKVSSLSILCSPDTVQFSNLSSNASSFIWDFGDGNTSTALSPYHVYTSYGTYDVKLIAVSACGKNDTLTKQSSVIIDASFSCIKTPVAGTINVTACNGVLTDNGGAQNNYSDNADGIVTISPTMASSVKLTFFTFNLEDYQDTTFSLKDSLIIYDGPDINSPVIGIYSGNTLPNGGTIISSAGSITVEMVSDFFLNRSGFELGWVGSGCISTNIVMGKNYPDVFHIFPNPNKSNFTINIESQEIINQPVLITMFNYLGEKIFSENDFCFNDKYSKELTLSNISSGIYYINIHAGKQDFRDKVIVVK